MISPTSYLRVSNSGEDLKNKGRELGAQSRRRPSQGVPRLEEVSSIQHGGRKPNGLRHHWDTVLVGMLCLEHCSLEGVGSAQA